MALDWNDVTTIYSGRVPRPALSLDSDPCSSELVAEQPTAWPARHVRLSTTFGDPLLKILLETDGWSSSRFVVVAKLKPAAWANVIGR